MRASTCIIYTIVLVFLFFAAVSPPSKADTYITYQLSGVQFNSGDVSQLSGNQTVTGSLVVDVTAYRIISAKFVTTADPNASPYVKVGFPAITFTYENYLIGDPNDPNHFTAQYLPSYGVNGQPPYLTIDVENLFSANGQASLNFISESYPYGFGGELLFRAAYGGTMSVVTPISITDVRLGIPTLNTVGTSRSLDQYVYVQGTGTGTISGHWLEDGQRVPHEDISQSGVTLSVGQWYKLGDFQGVLSGTHTLQFVVDNPAAMNNNPMGTTTKTEAMSITGFIPSVLGKGWLFPNNSNPYTNPDGTEFLGVCSGMSNSARDYYRRHQSTPQILTMNRVISGVLLGEQVDAEKWWGSTDYPRLVPYRNGTQSYAAIIDSEAKMVQDRLNMGDPAVIALDQTSFTGLAHAVVTTAYFFSDDIYNNVTGKAADHMELFSIYDPNFPQNDHRFVGAFYYNTQSQPIDFQFIPNDSDSYMIWSMYTYHE